MQWNIMNLRAFNWLFTTATMLIAFACLFAQPSLANPENASLAKGREFSKVRPELLKQGWRPVIYDGGMVYNTPWHQFGEVKVMYEAGFVEVEDCMQGAVYCFFNYRRGKQCLRVITQGEYGTFKGKQYPVIYKWSSECRGE